jgi:hypothetical protein
VFIEEIEEETNVLNKLPVPFPLTLANCEFVRCDSWAGQKFRGGQVFTKKLANEILNKDAFSTIDISTWGFHFSPITEEEYIEELKRIWVGKYPEIRVGDKFQLTGGGVHEIPRWGGNIEWEYFKNEDELFYYSLLAYSNGKWAEKVTCEDSAQVGETRSADPLAILDDFCISIEGYNQVTKFEVKYILDKKASFNSGDLIEVVTVAVNNYLRGKQQ